jgi:anti-anti-sigma regulatory factor
VLGKRLAELCPDRVEILDDLKRALDGEEHVSEHAWGERQLRTRYVPLKGPFGEILGAIVASEDATEQLRIEQTLREQIELIESQKRAIVELGTPIIEVFDDVLAVPVVGVIDESRAEQMMGALLDAIVGRQARFAILDLTGVEAVDAATASHLVKVISASRLLGCEGMITGIRPSVSSTFVEIGADLSQIQTLRSLKDALRFCERTLGRASFTRGSTRRSSWT